MPKLRKRSSMPRPNVAPQQRAVGANAPKNAVPRSDTKEARVIALLRRPAGATIEQMMKATGWQPHTVRGLLAGTLKKKRGMTIASEKSEGKARVYRLS